MKDSPLTRNHYRLADYLAGPCHSNDLVALCVHITDAINYGMPTRVTTTEVVSALLDWTRKNKSLPPEPGNPPVTKLTMPARSKPFSLRIVRPPRDPQWHVQRLTSDGTYETLSSHSHHDSAEVAFRAERDRQPEASI